MSLKGKPPLELLTAVRLGGSSHFCVANTAAGFKSTTYVNIRFVEYYSRRSSKPVERIHEQLDLDVEAVDEGCGEKDESFENRRVDAYHSGSRSPPYDRNDRNSGNNRSGLGGHIEMVGDYMKADHRIMKRTSMPQVLQWCDCADLLIQTFWFVMVALGGVEAVVSICCDLSIDRSSASFQLLQGSKRGGCRSRDSLDMRSVVDLLKSGAIRVTEFSSKQSYVVLVDSRVVQWMVERGGLEDFEAIRHSGRQMVLILGDNKQAWRKFLDALQDKHEGPNFKVFRWTSSSTSANGGLVCEPHRGTAAAEGGHPIRPLQRGNNVTVCDWEPALVIFRSSRYAVWEEIEERLTLALNRPTSLKAIGEDRAILFCSSEAERMRIIHRLESIGGDLVASTTPWKLELHWEDRKWDGLTQTRRRQNFESAIIKVKGRIKGFYPSELTISCPNGTAKLLISRTPEAVHLKAPGVVNPSDQHNLGVGRMDRLAELVADAPTLRCLPTIVDLTTMKDLRLAPAMIKASLVGLMENTTPRAKNLRPVEPLR
ncbi:hypothetical protein Syun_011280 [Stephania yunnanensis]|uniref:Uncharacterized protein n=1 Tax=Stephania yunnanensis TaxID=152371 RepID=A0AAP0PI09_9MAGN